MKRVTSIIMVLAMLVSLIPVNVSAEGLQEEPSQEVVQQEQSEQQSEEALEADSQEQTPEEEPEEGSQEPLSEEDFKEEPQIPEEELEEESQIPEKEPEVPAILTWEEYCYTLLADESVSICGFEGAPENEEEPFRVEIPSEINGSKVTEIAEKAFAGNGEIEGVLLPETIQTIGSGAFEDCKNLRAIAFLGTELAFGETLAKNAEKLQKILTLDGFDFCNLECILTQDFGEETIGSICFQTFDTHESVINAFEGSMEDTQITAEVDDEVISGTSIGTPSTEEISTLPEDVITASGKCGNNLTWTLFQDGTMVISGSGAMWHGYGTTEYDAYKEQIEHIVFEDGVNAIGGYAFAYCANLETVKFPDTVTTIGSDAFLGCSGLKELAIPDSVTTTGSSAFSGCTSLTDLSIGRGLTEISQSLFHGCTSLVTVVIPDSVTYIGQSAFQDCSSLKNVMIPTSVTAIGRSTAQGHSFASCRSLEEIYIPDSVTDIGVETFWNCTNLKNIRLPSQLKEIQTSLFSRCTSLETIEIPDGVERIGWYAFKGCTNLKEINLPDSIVSIGDQAFYDCSSLTNIVIPKKCNLAGSGGWDYIFNGCTSLTTVTIPVGVTLICTGAFNLCPSITDVYYEGSETQWNEIRIESNNEDLTNATIHFYGTVTEGSFQNHQYSVHDLSMTWVEAKEFCENLGGHLVTVTSAGEQAFLESLLPDPCTKRQYWLGASLENGAWRWVTGETFEYTNWDINRPDYQNGGEFAEIFNCSSDGGAYPATRYKWNDITYNNVSGNNPVVGADAIGFICEYDSLVPGYVRYFSSWDAENHIAYFGPGDMLGSQVTEETDVSFTENPTALLGQYVLVETKPRTDGDIGPDMLISVKALETRTGTVTAADAASITIDSKTYATPTNMTQPESYADQFVLYHLYNGNLMEVEILETIEGTLISWDEQTRLLNVNLDGAAKNPVVYTLSPLADADTVSRLNSGSLTNLKIQYIVDCSSLVYYVENFSPEEITGNFSYLAYNNKIHTYTYHYNEALFNNSSYQYQHELAKLSLRVAMAAGDVRTASGADTADGTAAIKSLMEELNFTYSDESSYPAPEYDSIGYCIGSKNITDPDGKQSTLILVAIRGSGYGAEWGGNFKIGITGHHEGFNTAAGQVLNGITSFVKNNSDLLLPNVKIWVTGFSRGAATANLVAARLVDNKYLDTSSIPAVTKEFVPGLKPDGVFAYCFECPQNTTDSAATQEKYSCIKNIVNPIDFVPKVAMSTWGFHRYGTTYYLPCKESTNNYSELKSHMEDVYRGILNYGISMSNSEAELSKALSESTGQASAFDELAKDLAYAAKDRMHYVKYYQDTMVDIFASKMGGANVEADLGKTCISALMLIPDLAPAIPPAIPSLTTLMYAHYMELCMAWLDSLDGLYQDVSVKPPHGLNRRTAA